MSTTITTDVEGTASTDVTESMGLGPGEYTIFAYGPDDHADLHLTALTTKETRA